MLRSLLRPRQTDFGGLDIAARKDALPGLEGHVDHRPVSVQTDEPAAVHRPQESGGAGIVEGPGWVTAKQRNGIPAQLRGALRSVFRGAQEVLTVLDELMPTKPRNVVGWTVMIKPGDPLDPIDWNGSPLVGARCRA